MQSFLAISVWHLLLASVVTADYGNDENVDLNTMQYDTPSDVWCPHPPCPPPVPDCQHVLPTFFFYEGRLCRGCDYCDDGQRKRMISENFPYCPDVQCETWAPPCPVQVQYQRIPVADYICTGCPFCPVDTTAASAKLLSG